MMPDAEIGHRALRAGRIVAVDVQIVNMQLVVQVCRETAAGRIIDHLVYRCASGKECSGFIDEGGRGRSRPCPCCDCPANVEDCAAEPDVLAPGQMLRITIEETRLATQARLGDL